jgi:hypothetical protein
MIFVNFNHNKFQSFGWSSDNEKYFKIIKKFIHQLTNY